jgi:hypothetical protein
MAGKAAFEAAESLSSYNDTTSEDSKLVQSTADSLDSSALAPAQLTAEWRSRRRPHEWRLQWLQCRLTSLALLSHAHDDLSEHCEHVLPDETLDEQLDQPSECTRTLPLHSRSHLRRRLLQHPPFIPTTAPHPAAYSLSNHASGNPLCIAPSEFSHLLRYFSLPSTVLSDTPSRAPLLFGHITLLLTTSSMSQPCHLIRYFSLPSSLPFQNPPHALLLPVTVLSHCKSFVYPTRRSWFANSETQALANCPYC